MPVKLFQNLTSVFREYFLRISSSPYIAKRPHSPEPCLLTDQNFANNFQQEGQDGPGLLTWFFEIALAVFREEFTRISLCLYSARSLHSLIPCLLTDQNFKNNSEKGHARNISMRLFQNPTNSFREDFLRICLYSYSQVATIHQSHVHGRIKFTLTILERDHSSNISVNWELEATYADVLID